MTREEWKAFASACRRAARERLKWGCRGTFAFDFTSAGVHYTASVERQHHTGKRYSGTPLRVYTSRLSERPRRSLSSVCLSWAAAYRRDARLDWRRHHPGFLERSISACRHEVDEARSYRTAFGSLPS